MTPKGCSHLTRDATPCRSYPPGFMKKGRPSRFRTADLLLIAAVAVGLALRLVRYVARASFWGDEGYLLLNLRTYDLPRLLTGRLDAVDAVLGYSNATQAGPVGFLAVLKLLTSASGPVSELVVRAMPFAFGCAGVVVFAFLARRLFPALAWAVVLAFAVHEDALDYSVTAKHYSMDVFAAVALAHVAVAARLSPAARAVAITAVALPMLLLSYAPVVVTPVALLAAWRKDPDASRHLRIYLTCAAVFVVAALAVKHFNVTPQQDPYLASYWAGAVPDWRDPVTVPGWLISTSVAVWNYAAPGLVVGLVLVAAQLVLLPERRFDAVTIMLVGPIAATLAGALLGLFPFQGRRVNLFLIPFLFLASVRAAVDLAALLRSRSTHPHAPTLPLVAIAIPGLICIVKGVRPSALDPHKEGRFRQLVTEILVTRSPADQLAALGPNP